MAYKHGIYVMEQATETAAARVSAAGLKVVVGTAPVWALKQPVVNEPVLVNSYEEAVEKMGWCESWRDYTLCKEVKAQFSLFGLAPLVLVNVLDPEKHSAAKNAELAVNAGKALWEQQGVLLDTLVVKDGETVLTPDADYTAAHDEDGNTAIALVGAQTVVQVSAAVCDPALVEKEEVVGSVNTLTRKECGLEAVRTVYPKLGKVPGMLLAPGYSVYPEVCAALQAKAARLNGSWRCLAVCDVDSGEGGARDYTAVKAQKEKQALNSAFAVAAWPCGAVGEDVYWGSTLLSCALQAADEANGDVPSVYASNRVVPLTGAVLSGGEPVYLDQEQANEVNAAGVVTFANLSGFRVWGNNTCAYPGSSDPKDRWIGCRRFTNWAANNFILNYQEKLDRNLDKRLAQTIVLDENDRGKGYVSRGYCAGYRMEFREEDNGTGDLLNGRVVFRQHITPYPPAEDIENVIDYDVDALEAEFAE